MNRIRLLVHRFQTWRRLRRIKRMLAAHGWEPHPLTVAEWRFLETEDPDLFANLRTLNEERA